MDETRAMQLVDEMAGDPSLRSEFQQDPIGTFERAGIELNQEDRETLESYQGLPDEELVERLSKGW